MATRPGDINANVGVALDASGMGGSLKTLQQQIASIIADLNKAGKAAQEAIRNGEKAGVEAAAMINQQVRTLGQLQNSTRTLGTANAKNLFGGFTDANSIGRMAAGVDKFFRGLEQGAPVIDKLSSRLTLMNQQASQMFSSGQTVPRSFWNRRLQVEEALAAFKRIEAAQTKFQERIGALSPANQQKLATPLANYQAALAQFDKLAANPRSNAALGAQLANLKAMSVELGKQVSLIEQEDKANQSLLRSTRAQAQALLNTTAAQREADLRAGANRYSTLLAGRAGGGQFNDIIGSPIANINKPGVDALTQSIRLAAAAQNQLNAAMVSNAPASRIQQLTARYEALLRMQQQSLALANRENDPGFFGGLKQGFLTVARGPGGESQGGLSGIGNVVGRVAAYTAAFRAINLVSQSISGAIQFTIQWEDQLAQLQAISGATGSEMQSLSQNILDVAKNSASSVQDITDSAKILAQAGYSARETGQLLQNVVDLSAASGTTPSESVDILTSAMGAFNLQVSDAGHITDALVTTLNRTKLSANQVQLGLQYLGATAKENNLTFEDLVATLGTAADAGIRAGSTMSTGTRQLLIDLQDPTKKLVDELKNIGLTMGDIDVKTRGFIPVLQTLHDHGFNAFQAIETRAAAMYEVLSNNLDEMQQLRDETLQTNTAHAAAEKRLTSLNAKWTEFKNRLAGIGADLGRTLLPLLKNLLDILVRLGDQIGLVVGKFQTLQDGLNKWTIEHHNNAVDRLNELFGDLGLNIHIAKVNTDDMNDSMDVAQTKLDDATAAVNDQRQKIKGLEDETQTLIARHDTLAKSSQSVQYEVDRLSQRFPGLRDEFSKTKGGIDGLIQAMEALDGKARDTLAFVTQQQANIAQGTFQIANKSAANLLRDLLQKYPTGSTHEALSLLGTPTTDPNFAVKRDRGQVLLDAIVTKFGHAADAFKEDAGRLIVAIQNAQQTRNVADNALRAFLNSAFSRTPQGQRFNNLQLEDNAQAESLISQVEGQPLAVRRNRIAALVKQIEDHIIELTQTIGNLAAKGDQAAVKAAQGIKTAEQNAVTRLKAAAQPTDEEQRKLDEMAKHRTMTSAEVRAALEREFPGIGFAAHGAGYRGPGDKYYEAGSWHSNMPGGHALDIGRLPSGVTIDNIVKFLETLGQAIDYSNKNSFWDERTRPAGAKNWSGSHFHIGWTAKDSAAMRQQQHEETEEERRLARVQRERQQAAKAQLDNLVDALGDEQDITKISAKLADIKAKTDEYVKQQMATANAEADRQGLTGEKRIDYLAAAKQKALEDAKDYYNKSIDNIGKALNHYLTEGQKLIEDHFQASLEALKNNLARQQGLLQGLDNPRLAGRVPDFTKAIQQHRVDLATQDLQDATFAANQIKLEELQKTLHDIQAEQDQLAATDPQGAQKVWQVYYSNVLQVQDAIRDLTAEQENLAAQSESIALIPQNWGEAIAQVADAWRIANNAGVSYNEQLWSHLGEVIDSAQGAFSQFFTDVITGTKGLASAFKDMGKAIIQTISEIMAKVIATQLMKFLLSFLGGSIAPASDELLNSGIYDSSVTSIFGYRGGLILGNGRPPKRFVRGGLVGAGIPTRDTVPAMLSQKEFVMRRSAVEDIGHKLLMDMNNRGRAALSGVGGHTIINQGGPVETNVYVVLPEEKPTLGPNDVLAVVHNDVLRNGATKTLIKRVAKGG